MPAAAWGLKMRAIRLVLGWVLSTALVMMPSFAQNIQKTIVGQGTSANTPSVQSILSGDDSFEKEIFSVLTTAQRGQRITRGANDIALFKKISSSVVLIQTPRGSGSGSVISDGLILTNWHVVRDFPFVAVMYKWDGAVTAQPSMTVAEVLKFDEVRDLAVVKPNSIPAGIKAIDFGEISDIQVGSDVHAIGHPLGKDWSYTKGVVSQIRDDYYVTIKDMKHHFERVIQTQTPISPGNSGGPLLTDDGRLIGVNSNSIVYAGAQNLNFAVSVTDVRTFLSDLKTNVTARRIEAEPAKGMRCVEKILFQGRNEENSGYFKSSSTRCDDTADFLLLLPDDIQQPMQAQWDRKRRNKADVYLYDPRRTGDWQYSYWDVAADGTFPLKGIHENGNLYPIRFERRCTGTADKNLRCSD